MTKRRLTPAEFKLMVEQLKRSVNIKDVLESTGALPVHANTAKGQYAYQSPWREDSKPSLELNVLKQSFTDHGNPDLWQGDVIELTRIIHGRGDKNGMTFFEAVEWLKSFSATSVSPKAIIAAQSEKKPSREATYTGERFQLVKSLPITAKSHPNVLDYIQARRISLRVASRHLWAVTYRDNAAPAGDALNGYRYGVGGPNDAGGCEVRAASLHSNFKTSLGAKGVSTYTGHPQATIGHIFNGRFDFLTRLEMTGENQPYHPSIITNADSLMGEAARTIKAHPQLQQVKHWLVWQDNDDSGNRSTQLFIDGLNQDGSDYQVYTVNHLYEGYKDLNKTWMDAPDQVRQALAAKIKSNVPAVQKVYDTSASAEMRRTHNQQWQTKFKPDL